MATCHPFRARDESRTHTSQLTLAPETSASTISPPALKWIAKIRIVREFANLFCILVESLRDHRLLRRAGGNQLLLEKVQVIHPGLQAGEDHIPAYPAAFQGREQLRMEPVRLPVAGIGAIPLR